MELLFAAQRCESVYGVRSPRFCPLFVTRVLARCPSVARLRLLALFTSWLTACAISSSLLAGPALADPASTSSLQAQAAQLASQIAAQASRIHALDAQYAQAQQRVNQTNQQLADAQAQLAQVERQVASTEASLHAQALTAYLQGGSVESISAVVDSKPDQMLVRHEYAKIAAGDTADVIDRLHLQRQALSARQAELADARKAEQDAASSLAHSEQAATAEVSAAQSTLTGLNAQIATLVAQNEAAQRAAAASAHNQQGHRLASVASVSSGGPAQGQPVPNGLSRVVGPPPPTGSMASDLAALRRCESGGNYATDSGNGYYGAYQMSPSTWQSLGYSGLPSQAAPAVQDQAATQLQARSGWGQWPTCSVIVGL